MKDFPRHLRLGVWALILSLWGMILLGGWTRLTGSGLSIVDWDPIVGIVPPLSEQDWICLFGKYKSSPEFQQVNSWFVLENFKEIFWLEYFHRLLGRCLGVLLCVLTLKCWRYSPLRSYLLALWGLGGLQGFVGWWMVRSGLQAVPWVSPFRLGIHLVLGAVILAVAVAMLARMRPHRGAVSFRPRVLIPRGIWLLQGGLLLLTIFWGALVAGAHAGLVCSTFPLMNGSFVPEGIFQLDPLWSNFVKNPLAIQWTHRLLAFAVWGTFCWGAFRFRPFWIPCIFATIQVALGALTVCWGVPPLAALIHQGFGLILWSVWLWGGLKYV